MGIDTSIYSPAAPDGPLRQGEILCDLAQTQVALRSESEELVADTLEHPFVIVVSQDCDLDWDYKARIGKAKEHKLIPNVLFCEVSTAEAIRGGGEINSAKWGQIKINKDERYHFLQAAKPEEDVLGQGLPELGIDFKRYFTIATQEVYFQIKNSENIRRCLLNSPYLEHFSTRFAYYQFRVALPADHFSEPVS